MRLNISILIVFIFVFLVGCNKHLVKEEYNHTHILKLDEENLPISYNEHRLLTNSHAYFEDSSIFTFATSFEPTEELKKNIDVLDDKYHFLVIKGDANTKLEGTFIVDNSTENIIDITLLILQGNSTAKIKVNNDTSREWYSAIRFSSKPSTTTEIPISINWDTKGAEDLIIFPLIHNDRQSRYDGANIGLTRTLVLNNDKSIPFLEKKINKQSFELPIDTKLEEVSFVPHLSWIGSDLKELNYEIINGVRYTTETIYGLELSPVPYDSEYDFLWVDEYGNVALLKEGIDISSNKSTFIYFENRLMVDEIYAKNQRQFIIVLNNRGHNMLADALSLNQNKKPFLTSNIGIIEIYLPTQLSEKP